MDNADYARQIGCARCQLRGTAHFRWCFCFNPTAVMFTELCSLQILPTTSSQFDRRKSATARAFSPNYHQSTESELSHTAHAFSSGGADSPRRGASTEVRYTQREARAVSPAGAVRRSASAAGPDTRHPVGLVQSDWDIKYNDGGIYTILPNRDGGYTRVHQDALDSVSGGSSSSGGRGVVNPDSYRRKKPYGHGVFIARSINDRALLGNPDAAHVHQPPRLVMSSHTLPQEGKRLSVSDARRQYEELDAIRSGPPPRVAVNVQRSASDVSHLRHYAPPNHPEDIYAKPDRALKRVSSYRTSGVHAAVAEEPDSPRPPPVPPPPPLSPGNVGSAGDSGSPRSPHAAPVITAMLLQPPRRFRNVDPEPESPAPLVQQTTVKVNHSFVTQFLFTDKTRRLHCRLGLCQDAPRTSVC